MKILLIKIQQNEGVFKEVNFVIPVNSFRFIHIRFVIMASSERFLHLFGLILARNTISRANKVKWCYVNQNLQVVLVFCQLSTTTNSMLFLFVSCDVHEKTRDIRTPVERFTENQI